MPPSLLKVVMKPIAAVGESYQYPPVNWAALLSPLMRLNFGKYQMFLGLRTLLLGCDLKRKRDSGSQSVVTGETFGILRFVFLDGRAGLLPPSHFLDRLG